MIYALRLNTGPGSMITLAAAMDDRVAQAVCDRLLLETEHAHRWLDTKFKQWVDEDIAFIVRPAYTFAVYADRLVNAVERAVGRPAALLCQGVFADNATQIFRWDVTKTNRENMGVFYYMQPLVAKVPVLANPTRLLERLPDDTPYRAWGCAVLLGCPTCVPYPDPVAVVP
jgi:hypothetical protein